MATAPRSFRRSVAQRKEERPVVTFTLDWVSDTEFDEEGEPLLKRTDTFHAQKPTEERMFMVSAVIGSDESQTSEAAAIFGLLSDVLPADEFATLRHRLLDPEDDVNLDMLQEVILWLMGEWASFPTQQSSDSSASPTNTCPKSTGRVRGPGSTRSASPSIAS